MKTIYDFVSIAIFAGIAVLYLQRSASDEPDDVAIWKYALVAVGCAVGNLLGNEGRPIMAAGVLAAVIVGSVVMLKPFEWLLKR